MAELLTQNVLVLLDDGVHDGLGKHRLINLIVTVFPEKGEKM
jgi:hypothetical protein